MSNEVVIYEKKGPIAHIVLNRPEKVNCMNGDVYRLLQAAVEDYGADNELRCAIISGAGGNFSSGGDLRWFREQREAAKARGRTFQYDFPAYRAMDYLRKPVIAAVDGHCLASGFQLALLFCDIRVCTSRARFGSPAVLRGLNDAGNRGIYPMPFTWYMGLGNALYMMLTGKLLSAEEALRMGIVNEVVGDELQLMPRATELAEMICKNSPRAVQEQKMLLRRFQEVPGSFYSRLREIIFRGEDEADYFEGTKAFLEKRSPDWNKQ
jgi:enoyl-CoA hydratase/carnithine racemase